EPIFLRALQITVKTLGAEHPITARTLQNLAQLNAATGNIVRAREFWQRASAIEEKNLPLSLATGSERQNLAYFDTFMGNAEKIISFQFHEASTDAATRELAATTLLQRKGRVLDALAGNFESLRNRSNPEDRALLDQLKNVTSKLANLVLNGPGKSSLAEQQQQIKSLSEQRDSLEIEIGRRSAGYYQSSAAVTLRAIRDAVPPEAALVEYAIYQPYDPRSAIESI